MTGQEQPEQSGNAGPRSYEQLKEFMIDPEFPGATVVQILTGARDDAGLARESPVWQVTGAAEAPTMAPSLGCPKWRDGTCVGHWWLRDGELVLA